MSNGATAFQRRKNAVLFVVVVVGGKNKKKYKVLFHEHMPFYAGLQNRTTRRDGDREEFHWKRENKEVIVKSL